MIDMVGLAKSPGRLGKTATDRFALFGRHFPAAQKDSFVGFLDGEKNRRLRFHGPIHQPAQARASAQVIFKHRSGCGVQPTYPVRKERHRVPVRSRKEVADERHPGPDGARADRRVCAGHRDAVFGMESRDRVVSVQNRHAGDVVCQQGGKVVHRAEKLHAPAERTTVVISYVVRIRLITEHADKLPLGSQANVVFVSQSVENEVLVPNEAVRYVLDERGVYLQVDSEKVPGKKVPKFKAFRAGLDNGMYTQVIKGLTEGDVVYTRLPRNRMGQEVTGDDED